MRSMQLTPRLLPALAAVMLWAGCEQVVRDADEPEGYVTDGRDRPDTVLACPGNQPAPPSTVVLGAQGGSAATGLYVLEVPPGALRQDVEIELRGAGGDTVGVYVRTRPARPRLHRAAILSIDLGPCEPYLEDAEGWFVWHFPGGVTAGQGRRLGAVLDGLVMRAYLGETSGFIIGD